MNKAFILRWSRLCLLPLLLACLLLIPQLGRAQGGPPPPPTEGLDPKNAPASSRETGSAPAPPASGAPAPPTEGLDPKNAPATSTGSTSAAPAATTSEKPTADAEEHTIDNSASAKASPMAVFGLDFMQRALVAGLLVSGACAFLGVYVVLRRVVFVGVALAEMSSAGVALGLLTGLPPMVGSVLTMFAGVVLLSVRWGGRRIRQDAFIGIGYVVASAMAVLLIAKSPSGEGSLLDLLFGNILTDTASDVIATAIALALVLAFHAAVYKEMLFVAFDPDTASASGYRSRLWEMALYLSIGLTIAFSIHAVGVMMTFAALVIPPVTALLLTKRMHTAFGVSVLAGMVPVPLGLYLSFVADLPAAATVVVVSFTLLVVAGLFSRLKP